MQQEIIEGSYPMMGALDLCPAELAADPSAGGRVRVR